MNLKIVVIALSLVILAGCKTEVRDLERIINSYDYVRLKLPSTLFQPGTLVYRSKYDPDEDNPNATSLGFLCNPKWSTKLYESDPITSSSESVQIARDLRGSFSISPEALLEVFKLNATAKAAKSVNISIQDMEVTVFARDDMARIRRGLGPDCREQLETGIRKGNAFQVEKVLTASVAFVVNFDTAASLDLKARAIQELGEIGVVIESAKKTEVRGEALIYGITWLDRSENL